MLIHHLPHLQITNFRAEPRLGVLVHWERAGVWKRVWQVLLDRLAEADQLDWNRAALDLSGIPGEKGGDKTGSNPTDKGKLKRHVVVDAQGVPLALKLTGANVHDSLILGELLDMVPAVHSGRRGRPRLRPEKLHADKAYDFPRCRQSCTERNISHRITRRGIEGKQRLGKHRWVVERTQAWYNQLRRLVIRYERRANIHQALLNIGLLLICCHFVQRFC